MKDAVFLDTGIFVAFLNRRDQWHAQAVALPRRQLSCVDASSLCLVEEHRIKRAWSTDHHLSLTGAEILPRS